MSKTTRIAFLIFLSISFFFSAFIAALRVMALEDFEIATHYFAHGAKLPSAVNYLLFACVLIFFVCGLFLRGRISLSPSDRGIPFYFANAVLGASLAAYALFSFPVFFEHDRLSSFDLSSFPGILFLLCTLFAVVGVFFCIHNCLFPNAEKNRRLLFGLSIPLFAILNVLSLYFDRTAPLNAPNKIFDQFTYVFVALYLLYELRVFLKEPHYAVQCTLGLITMVFTAANGFPSFIYMLTKGQQLSDNAAHDILMIAFFLYVAIRMLHILFTESAKNDHVMDLLAEAEHPAATWGETSDDTIEGEEEDLQLTFDTVDAAEIEIIPEIVQEAPFSEDGREIRLDGDSDGEESAPAEAEEEAAETETPDA